VVSTFTRVPEVRRVIDLLLAELDRARQDPPSEAELADARTLAVGNFALSLETADEVMSSLVDLEVYGLPPDSLDSYRARVRASSAEEIAAQAQRLLHPERAGIVLVGPAAQLEPQLEGLGPVEVVRP
jgi:zinc protease